MVWFHKQYSSLKLEKPRKWFLTSWKKVTYGLALSSQLLLLYTNWKTIWKLFFIGNFCETVKAWRHLFAFLPIAENKSILGKILLEKKKRISYMLPVKKTYLIWHSWYFSFEEWWLNQVWGYYISKFFLFLSAVKVNETCHHCLGVAYLVYLAYFFAFLSQDSEMTISFHTGNSGK